MHTARSPSVHATVATRGGGPQVNMFEHVSYLNHQMSLAGGRCPQMNKFEQVSSVDDQMSLVGGGLV